jgi:hypothetical protein
VRRLPTLAAILVLAAGCASSPDARPAAYLSTLHRQLAGTDYADVPDKDLLQLGREVCESALSREQLIGVARDKGLDTAAMAVVVDAAHADLC